MARASLRLAALIALLAGAPEARAGLAFNFIPTTSGMTRQQLDGFAAAGALWSNLFSDDITVNLNIGFLSLGAGVLGQTDSSQDYYNYRDVRSHLVADRTSADDATATANLSPASGVKMLINRTQDSPSGAGSATPYLDSNGSVNNTTIYMTNANAKALGMLPAGNAAVDATILFSSDFNFDYDRSDGISASSFDFVGIAAHEIGHALGFISGVDILDGNGGGQFPSDAFTFVSTLDLFRYSALSRAAGPGVIDWTADDRTKYFSLDGGTTSTGATFSTGQRFGDGWQASHWKDGLGLGIMDPTAAPGEMLTISANDIRAFDAIGYNLASVPEPASLAMTGFAVVVGLGVGSRRRAGAGAA